MGGEAGKSDGTLYDPVADRRRCMATLDAPPSRSRTLGAYASAGLFIYAGTNVASNRGWRYTP